MVRCSKCQSLQNDGAKICANCGADLMPGYANSNTATPSYNFQPVKASFFKEFLCCILVVALLLGTIIGYKYSTEEHSQEIPPQYSVNLDSLSPYIFYIKDNNLFFDPCDGRNPIMLEYNYIPYEDFDECCYASLDMTKVVYVMGNGDGTYKLRWCDITDDRYDTTDICSNVGDWTVNADANEIVYVDKSNDFVYKYNFKTSVSFSVAADNLVYVKNNLIFFTRDTTLYRLDSDDGSSSWRADNFYSIEGETAEALYFSCGEYDSKIVLKYNYEDGHTETLLRNVKTIIKLYDNGDMYYTKKNMDTAEISSLYYCNAAGTIDTCLSEEYSNTLTVANDRPYTAFYEINLVDSRKTLCVVENDIITRLSGNIDTIYVGENENEFYYTANCNAETRMGELYSTIYTNKRFIESTLIDIDVFKHSVTVVNNGSVYYLKEYNMSNEEGNLYSDGNFIDENVSEISKSSLNNKIFYTKERMYTENGFSYKLMAYDGYNTEIATNVVGHSVNNDKLYYAVSENDEDNSTLFVYDGTSGTMISENVSASMVFGMVYSISKDAIIFSSNYVEFDSSYDVCVYKNGNLSTLAYSVSEILPNYYQAFSIMAERGEDLIDVYLHRIYSIAPSEY